MTVIVLTTKLIAFAVKRKEGRILRAGPWLLATKLLPAHSYLSQVFTDGDTHRSDIYQTVKYTVAGLLESFPEGIALHSHLLRNHSK